ncbi:hypothetical protein DPMN_053762 [Dreissena polymorpha]|uniref:Uncharacterized protein n=1 Tax=Dreissena polymorpha TaxID=45954 RepID=A0A9D4CMQ1_DREPO|nr:hypothetical protein DPMN_053762 [Dreissena polymorpha]
MSEKQDSIGIAPLRSNGHQVTDSQTIAEILVNQFQSVFTKDDNFLQAPVLSDHV